jgi:hypothetical protein
MIPEHDEPKMRLRRENNVNLNTILLCCTIGLLGWLGTTTHNNAVTLATVSASMMPRVEIETKIESIKTEIVQLQLRASALEMRQSAADNAAGERQNYKPARTNEGR